LGRTLNTSIDVKIMPGVCIVTNALAYYRQSVVSRI
jgi:hypothetical protein